MDIYVWAHIQEGRTPKNSWHKTLSSLIHNCEADACSLIPNMYANSPFMMELTCMTFLWNPINITIKTQSNFLH